MLSSPMMQVCLDPPYRGTYVFLGYLLTLRADVTKMRLKQLNCVRIYIFERNNFPIRRRGLLHGTYFMGLALIYYNIVGVGFLCFHALG